MYIYKHFTRKVFEFEKSLYCSMHENAKPNITIYFKYKIQ